MNPQDVFSRFALIANLTLEEAEPWFPICAEAVQEIRLKLRNGVSEENNSRRLTAAAAALGFYEYTLYRASGEGMEAFSAGDIKIGSEKQVSVSIALAVWKNAKATIADLIEDEGFSFCRVKTL